MIRYLSLILGLALLASAPLQAHNMPGSAVALEFHTDGVAAELVLPLMELELAFKQSLLPASPELLARHETALRAYITEHIRPVSPSGRPWTVEVRELSLQLKIEPYDLVAQVWLRPPTGETTRRFTLNYDVIGHEVNNHYALLTVRRDWETAVFGEAIPVGVFQYTVKSIEIDRGGGSWRRGFSAVFRHGLHHIAEGTDHLLFLLVLLLPGPLVAAGRRWGSFGGWRLALGKLVRVVTAFTAGHSLTLVVGALGWVRLPSQPVELLIAGSILVSAVHAARPCFAGKETWIAAGFGLVHGLAFAGSLTEFGFSPLHLVLSILAFNLGIECMQLVVVLCVMPSLLLLARTRLYPAFRWTGAIFGGVAALGWIAERVSGRPNAVAEMLTLSADRAAPFALGLFTVAVALAWLTRRRIAGSPVEQSRGG